MNNKIDIVSSQKKPSTLMLITLAISLCSISSGLLANIWFVNAATQNIAPNVVLKKGKRESVKLRSTKNLKVKSLKLQNGYTGWSVQLPGKRALATPAFLNGNLFVGGGFGSRQFYSFNAVTGKPNWAIDVSDDGPTAAVAENGLVAFNTESCTLFVVDAKTGKALWSKWLGDPLLSQPAILKNTVYMAYPEKGNHTFVAMNIRTGKVLWRQTIAGDVITAPIVHQGSVYATTFNGTVYHFDAMTGKKIWQKDMKATSAPTIVGEEIFVSQRKVGDKKNQKYKGPSELISRMKKDTGINNQKKGAWRERQARWLDNKVQRLSKYHKKQLADDASVGFSSVPSTAKSGAARSNIGQGRIRGMWEYQGSRPILFNGRLFVTQGDQIAALDPKTGKEYWKFDLKGELDKVGGHLAAPPSPAGDKLYIATVDKSILILSQKTGKLVDKIQLNSAVRFQPSIMNGRLFIGTTTGELISIKLKDTKASGWAMWGGNAQHNGPGK